VPLETPFAAAATAPAVTPGIGSSLAGLGTAVKVLVLTHPVSLAAVGGVLLGAGVYHALTRERGKASAPAATPVAT